MNKSIVAVVRCMSYDEEEVYEAVKKGINLVGGIENIVKKGEKILLKPNVLLGDRPERQATTNPIVFKAVGRVCKEFTNDIFYGDSPGFGKPLTQLRKSLIAPAADEINIKLADFERGKVIVKKNILYNKKFIIANGVLDCDCVINLPKMKTHGLARITGAVKNLFGCIPGILKAEYHLKLPNIFDFAKMLVALNFFTKARLHIMDGIMAMEGNGPGSGQAIKMNVLLFSKDPIALDSAFCKIIDMNPEYVPTIMAGKEAGLGKYLFDEIEFVGDPIEDFVNKKFKVVRKPLQVVSTNGIVTFLKNIVSPKPVINKKKCTKCGLCVNICPVKDKAVNWHNENKNSPPIYNYKICIRCYCCQELCPEGAIKIKTSLLGKIFGH